MSTTHLVGHRGQPTRHPENSIAGLASAVEAGARFVEIDVQASADGTLWLFHDPGLLRLCGRPGKIAETSDDRLAKLELLALPGGRPEPLATLHEFAGWLRGTPDELTAFVEIKPEVVADHGPAATLREVLDDLGDVAERCVLISFALPLLAEVRRAGDRPIAPILTEWAQQESDELRALEPEWVFVNRELIPPGPLPKAGFEWVVYETVDPTEARDLIERGARLVETFAIAAMSAALESRA